MALLLLYKVPCDVKIAVAVELYVLLHSSQCDVTLLKIFLRYITTCTYHEIISVFSNKVYFDNIG